MTNNTKILLGVGAIALAYYFYTKRSKGGTQSQVGTTPSPSPKNGGIGAIPKEQPTKSEPKTIPNAYRLKEDFSKSVMTRPNVYVDVKFKKGQIISALRNPYESQSTAVGMGALSTTPQGGLPNFQMDGQVWISIPERLLEKVN